MRPTASLANRLLAVALRVGLCVIPLYASAAEPSDESRAQQRSANVAHVVQGIINYARWPQTPQPLNLCIVAPTEYADLLWQHSPETSRYPIQVKRVLIDHPQLASECQVVYLGAADSDQRRELLNRLIGYPILTISERDQTCSEGSLFCLTIDDEYVGFHVNLDAVARSGIRIHPNVLKLAKHAGSQP